jgi:hypothetical protein
MQDDLPLLYMLAGMHQNFLDDAAIQALHHLNLTRRNHLALASHHFINATQASPEQQNHHGDQDTHINRREPRACCCPAAHCASALSHPADAFRQPRCRQAAIAPVASSAP